MNSQALGLEVGSDEYEIGSLRAAAAAAKLRQ